MTQTTHDRSKDTAAQNDPAGWAVYPAAPTPGTASRTGGQPPHHTSHSWTDPAERRRPGWTGLLAVGACAALLSSVLTVGAINAFGQPAGGSGPGSAGAASTTGQPAPLVAGSASAANWVAVAAAAEPSVVSVRVQAADGSGERDPAWSSMPRAEF